ncbi:MAG TPA: ATP-binding protein [Acidobacteriaceae bacterium]|nr:ATP-binding protein [Acidobacteriaceae bacterium]
MFCVSATRVGDSVAAAVPFLGAQALPMWIAGVAALIAALVAGFAAGRRAVRFAPAPLPSPAAPAPPAAPEPASPQPGEMQQMLSFVQAIAQLNLHRKPGPQLASLVKSILRVEAVAILDADLGEVYRQGEWFEELENVIQNVYLFETVHDDSQTGLMRRVLRMGNLPIGAMVLRGDPSPAAADAIATLLAITFDRYHAFANESRTERARQTEQLRTTVLDSLAHAYKTPLTAIRAASSGLTAMGNMTPAQSGLVALIEEQSNLLNHLTTRLLKTAQMEARELATHSERIALLPLMEDVVAGMQEPLGRVSVEIEVVPGDLSLVCDRSLLAAVLSQYLDNAGKYANEGTTVTVRAAEQPGEVVLSVHNHGPAIPPSDYERIFDRYFRSSIPANKAPGTGVGLSIAKRAAQIQGGYVWVASDCDEGTTFFVSLPAGGAPDSERSPGA